MDDFPQLHDPIQIIRLDGTFTLSLVFPVNSPEVKTSGYLSTIPDGIEVEERTDSKKHHPSSLTEFYRISESYGLLGARLILRFRKEFPDNFSRLAS